MSPAFTTIIYCLLSAVFGCVATIIFGRIRRSATADDAASKKIDEATVERTAAEKERQLRQIVDSLYQLTSQVDSQVGQHTLRVNEITNTLEEPDEGGSSMVLAAGKLLISANQKLQADLEEAKSEIQRQREQTNVCMLESRTDALTGLNNRRAFDLEIVKAFAQRRRSGKPLSLLIIDVDHFKRVNDRYGHMVGDRLLKGFSRCLLNTFRESDFVARYGGEEFVAILPNTPLSEAIKTAERVRTAVSDSRFRVGELEMQITASVGVKQVDENETEAELMEKADAAMYAAKRGGRDRCFYHDGQTCHLFVPEQPKNFDSHVNAEPMILEILETEATLAAAQARSETTNPSQPAIDLELQLQS